MKAKAIGLCVAALGAVLASAGEPADGKKDYPDLSKMIHKMVAGQFPKVYEQDTDWGTTIPDPGDLRLPRLRTRVMVNGREELPHGLWRKVKARVEDPERDVKLRVTNLEQQKDGTYRLTLEVDAVLRGEMEVVKWQKGLRLLNLIGEGDAVVGMTVTCDVKVTLDPKEPLKKVRLEPTVTDLKMGLKDFALNMVALKRLGPVLEGEAARTAGDFLRGLIEGQIQSLAPGMKERFNEGMARSVAEGKTTVPSGELLKAIKPARN
jgi:hypothetical protein